MSDALRLIDHPLVAALVMQVLAGAETSKKELDEIKQLLDEKRGGRR